jgi:dihydrofolate reductase/thymidylate synthase
MPIKLIACIINYKNKLAIGRNNELLCKLKHDMSFFKHITTNDTDANADTSKLNKNVVIMGRKTWFSIPQTYRPLSNRINIVLTNNKTLLKTNDISYKNINKLNSLNNPVVFLTYVQFLDFYKRFNANVFVIGGSEIYNLFLKNTNSTLKPSTIYFTEVFNYKIDKSFEPDSFLDPLDETYKLISISEKKHDNNQKLHYRFLKYKWAEHSISQEHKYLDFCQYILKHGNERVDRTGIGTISSFGHHITFDISNTVPLLTTKRIPWKHVIEELLWFIRGDTDAKILQNKGIKIWDGNTSRQFLDSRGLHHYEEGVLGKGYGWQWRFFGADYNQKFADTSNIENVLDIGGFDQLEYIINELRTNPYSRRILMSYWNPPDFNETSLLPCHYSCQFYVEEHGSQRYLNCLFNMRSNDMFLGNPFNIFSYAVLTYILAIKCDMNPGKLIYSIGDAHIYKNHIKQMETQLLRKPYSQPVLIVNPDVKYKLWNEININDFEIIGYFPYPSIKAEMAV